MARNISGIATGIISLNPVYLAKDYSGFFKLDDLPDYKMPNPCMSMDRRSSQWRLLRRMLCVRRVVNAGVRPAADGARGRSCGTTGARSTPELWPSCSATQMPGACTISMESRLADWSEAEEARCRAAARGSVVATMSARPPGVTEEETELVMEDWWWCCWCADSWNR